MYRYLSSIRHARGSSLRSLFPPKPSLPSSSSSRALIEHVRGFSTSNGGPTNPFSRLGRENLNSRNENDGNETLGKDLNLDSFRFPTRDRETMNSRSESSIPDVFSKLLKSDSSPFETRGSENGNLRSENGAVNERSINRGSDGLPFFMRGRENVNSGSESGAGNVRNFNRVLDGAPFFMRDRENMSSRSENDAAERSYRPMDFVRGVVEEDGKDYMRGSPFSAPQLETDADFVHIKMLRNNTFVTVTDSKGNIKLSGSAGSLKEMKSGQKLSRYAAEATAEVVGRRARGLGLKAVVMKVNGFTHFRRKRQAIMSWMEGFNVSRGDKSRSPVVYIEDTTRKPHNGCRLPKKRRI